MNAIRPINSSDENLYNPRHISQIMSQVLAKYEPVVAEKESTEESPASQQRIVQQLLPRSEVATLAEVYLSDG